MSEHPSLRRLEQLVAGALGVTERESALDHLAECEACMERAESLWPAVGEVPEDTEMPPMTAESQSRIERQLFRRIRVAATGNELAWLVTGGFLSTILVLLRPFLASERASEFNRGAVR